MLVIITRVVKERFIFYIFYKMRFKDNICPAIEQIFQRKTYHGLLEGVPNTAINQGMLHRVVEKGKRLFGIDTIHLIRPTENI